MGIYKLKEEGPLSYDVIQTLQVNEVWQKDLAQENDWHRSVES